MNSLSQGNFNSNGRPISVSEFESTKVVQISSFLSEEERESFFGEVCANQAAFKPPGLAPAEPGGSMFLYSDSKLSDDSEASIVDQVSENLSKRILEALPALFDALEMAPFPVSELQPTMIHGLDGHYGTPHTDDCAGRNKLTVLYYIHKTPKAFSGGELELYASDSSSPHGYRETPIARIEQKDNLLLAFASETYHGVAPVQCDSGNFEDGRFVSVCFLGP